ncbi:Uncharacterised protein [Mycobacterium tuberculosis]|uniref:Uncharacterized protein n=1 Tax=Mycobacterium tuberculosis TaxID=1773 RepID=A0A654U274_MYCTX|nr:Uncharacterised protein [Mycobacterium tuberculosis]CKS76241.1 Uncharacterised protein [Mycobacterium tuberculosis]CNV87053.1 Uncharacterised protein [Mycobacterium tuberculosis]COY77152.1 Uncharacterised protein [Mycobacterium tuberculosis]CPA41651.1 Uncharacterised protein [Mycobacterium tuberculosis]
MDLIGGYQTADQLRAAHAELLGDRHQWGYVVRRVRIVGGQKRVVKVKFTRGDAVGPGRPVRRVAALDAKYLRPVSHRMRQCLVAGHGDRSAHH